MNEFYSISEEHKEPIDDFQLKNLGNQRIMAIVGKRTRGDWGENRGNESQKFYRDTKPSDYDDLFEAKLINCDPPYELSEILEYHLRFYMNVRQGNKLKFIKQVKYVILPKIKNRKNKDVQIELVKEWINQMNEKETKDNLTNLQVGDINAPTQFLVNSDNSSQNQTIHYNKEDLKQLLNDLRSDLAQIEKGTAEELRSEIDKVFQQLEAKKNVTYRLLTIGDIVKNVGYGVFSNLIASPVYENLKPLLGL